MSLYFFYLHQVYHFINLPPDFRAVIFDNTLVKFPQPQAFNRITLGLRTSYETFSPGYL